MSTSCLLVALYSGVCCVCRLHHNILAGKYYRLAVMWFHFKNHKTNHLLHTLHPQCILDPWAIFLNKELSSHQREILRFLFCQCRYKKRTNITAVFVCCSRRNVFLNNAQICDKIDCDSSSLVPPPHAYTHTHTHTYTHVCTYSLVQSMRRMFWILIHFLLWRESILKALTMHLLRNLPPGLFPNLGKKRYMGMAQMFCI